MDTSHSIDRDTCPWCRVRPPARLGSRARLAFALFLILCFAWIVLPPERDSLTTWLYASCHGRMPTRTYKSFAHSSPALNLVKQDPRCSRDHIIFNPTGPAVLDPGAVILDSQGELVWRQTVGQSRDLRVQEYRGEKFLTYWVGETESGAKNGLWYLMDQTYTVRHRVGCKSGMSCDMHQFELTADGTALLVMYYVKPADLTSIGGSPSGQIRDCKFQEVDVETGAVRFEWTASEHFAVTDTYVHYERGPRGLASGCGRGRGHDAPPLDFFHITSLQKDALGNYLVSARNTNTVSYVDARSGRVLWNLGGKRNDFEDLSGGAATNFARPHGARWRDGHVISIFDSACRDWCGEPGCRSRAILVDMDTENKTAALLADYSHPDHLRSPSQGNAQPLASGNMFVGWGGGAAFSEFSAAGELLCDARFGAPTSYVPGSVSSYRVTRDRWVGRPAEPPSAVLADDGHVYVSWNGATEVRLWVLEEMAVGRAGTAPRWHIILDLPKDRFETSIKLPLPRRRYTQLRVVALDRDAKYLAQAEVVDLSLKGAGWCESAAEELAWLGALLLSWGGRLFLATLAASSAWGLVRRVRRRVRGERQSAGPSVLTWAETDKGGRDWSLEVRGGGLEGQLVERQYPVEEGASQRQADP